MSSQPLSFSFMQKIHFDFRNFVFGGIGTIFQTLFKSIDFNSESTASNQNLNPVFQ